MKFIILTDSEGLEIPIIFSRRITHKHMAERMIHLLRRENNIISDVVSAGFCNGMISAGGESESLNIKSRNTDSLSLSFNDYTAGLPIAELDATMLKVIKDQCDG